MASAESVIVKQAKLETEHIQPLIDKLYAQGRINEVAYTSYKNAKELTDGTRNKNGVESRYLAAARFYLLLSLKATRGRKNATK